jgi:hypothetical protein
MKAAWDAQKAAEEAFAAAQMAVAMVKPRDHADLVLMSCLVFLLEEASTGGGHHRPIDVIAVPPQRWP